jgi:anthranilate synthase component 2
MIDNYDSFTYNLVQYFAELGVETQVYRNDQINLDQISKLNPEKIVISPGPCTPNESGITLRLIQKFSGKIPIFGVCLGYQAIGQAFGGKIVLAKKPMHGKTSLIFHNNKSIFQGLTVPFRAARYHSLVIDKKSLPDCFEITAWTQNNNGDVEEIMGIKHKQLALEGVQFHPESIATEYGHELLNNFLKNF